MILGLDHVQVAAPSGCETEARRFYGERNPDKQGRSERRFPPDRRTERVKNWLRDLLGGSPEDEYLAKVAARSERDKAG